MMTFAPYFLILPLAAFAIQIFFGKRLPRKGDWVSITAVGTTLCLAIAMFVMMLFLYEPGAKAEQSFEWFNLGELSVKIGVLIDNVTVIMLLVVALVSGLVHLYSVGYMKDDPRYSRYFGYLSLFTFSMNGIILSNNLLSIYMFWELVGLSSYLLIGFWFEKDSAANASKKAFLVNRVGDIGMFIGIMLFFTATGSFLFSDIFAGVAAGALPLPLLTVAGLCLFAGAIGKSAQVPLHVWLPDAMEGPTPVSALIHAATMVAAGVYLTFRMFPLFTPEALTVIAYVGGVTAIFAAIIAVTQNDIKRVLAYSTVSQLGYMVMAIGTGAYVAGFFHLTTHAAFKAALFLCSGSVIHAMHHAYHKLGDHDSDPQDMRNMGGMKSKMKITFLTMFMATLALSGVPFMSGFLSKDAILAGTLSFASHHPEHFLLPLFGFGAALLTAFYMFRLIFMTFYGKPAKQEVLDNIHESPATMTTPLIVLATLSIFIVYTLPYINPFSDHGWFTDLIVATNSVVPQHVNPSAHEIAEGIHHAHLPAMIISLIVAFTGIALAVVIYLKKKFSAEKLAKNLALPYKLSFNKFFVDEIYDRFLINPTIKLAKAVGFFDWEIYDKYFINGFGRITERLSRFIGITMDYDVLDQQIVDGVGKSTRFFGGALKFIQTGKIQNYLVWVLGGIIIIFIIQAM
ncbi:MAG: NADH-quinone oxidoreductase subunit L [Candidatus Marinimicrobia bacterium]|jgi:NADH-quinone oxidoreductase subunit L|nr:NADH-quinone oxidoreductase subunit L [Candidatus Neomarinimicrobiota bacterium]|tara:strand:+ start:2618 stop:4663 length:2046 start_codon:yes stop_codon:yes gene_type:complete